MNAGSAQVRVYTENNIEKGRTWGLFKDATWKLWTIAKARKDAFFCDQYQEWFAKSEFKPIEVDGFTLCYEFADFYWWKSDDNFHLVKEPPKEKAELRAALEAACQSIELAAQSN